MKCCLFLLLLLLFAFLRHVYNAEWCVSLFFLLLLSSFAVRREVCANVRINAFTVAILAQGTNRGDALCAALLLNRVVSILHESIYFLRLCFTVLLFCFVLVCVRLYKNQARRYPTREKGRKRY